MGRTGESTRIRTSWDVVRWGNRDRTIGMQHAQCNASQTRWVCHCSVEEGNILHFRTCAPVNLDNTTRWPDNNEGSLVGTARSGLFLRAPAKIGGQRQRPQCAPLWTHGASSGLGGALCQPMLKQRPALANTTHSTSGNLDSLFPPASEPFR